MRFVREAAQPQIVLLSQRQILLQTALLGDRKREGCQRSESRGRKGGRGGGTGEGYRSGEDTRLRASRERVCRERGMADADCLFCRITSRQVKADIVAETGELLAIKDINPQAPT